MLKEWSKSINQRRVRSLKQGNSKPSILFLRHNQWTVRNGLVKRNASNSNRWMNRLMKRNASILNRLKKRNAPKSERLDEAKCFKFGPFVEPLDEAKCFNIESLNDEAKCSNYPGLNTASPRGDKAEGVCWMMRWVDEIANRETIRGISLFEKD